MTERWLPVLGFEGLYRVSSEGRVWSERRDHEMRLQSNKDGYLTVLLCRADGKQSGRMVHALVLEAFVGPRPPGMEGCHGPAGRTVNRPENLRWDTHTNNMRDRTLHGWRAPVGEAATNSKLTDEQVLAIRAAPRREGAALARSFGVSKGVASQIRCGQTWGHLAGAIPGAVECRGEDHPNAKLTAEIAASIRADTRFQKAIAADYGVHQVTVSKIKRGLLWAEAA